MPAPSSPIRRFPRPITGSLSLFNECHRKEVCGTGDAGIISPGQHLQGTFDLLFGKSKDHRDNGPDVLFNIGEVLRGRDNAVHRLYDAPLIHAVFMIEGAARGLYNPDSKTCPD